MSVHDHAKSPREKDFGNIDGKGSYIERIRSIDRSSSRLSGTVCDLSMYSSSRDLTKSLESKKPSSDEPLHVCIHVEVEEARNGQNHSCEQFDVDSFIVVFQDFGRIKDHFSDLIDREFEQTWRKTPVAVRYRCNLRWPSAMQLHEMRKELSAFVKLFKSGLSAEVYLPHPKVLRGLVSSDLHLATIRYKANTQSLRRQPIRGVGSEVWPLERLDGNTLVLSDHQSKVQMSATRAKGPKEISRLGAGGSINPEAEYDGGVTEEDTKARQQIEIRYQD